MKRLFRHALVVARRDFVATVLTPTFILFLLTPFFMIGLSIISGKGAASIADKAIEGNTGRVVALVSGETAKRFAAADVALRGIYREGEGPPPLLVTAPGPSPEAQARAELNGSGGTAVLFGPPERPHILYLPPSDRHARYLAELAEQAARGGAAQLASDARISAPVIAAVDRPPTATKPNGKSTALGAVFVIFLLSLLLAGQAVGTLAEEKGNKVIEILAAAVRLESVFLGKLIGLFGTAAVFIAFWATILGGLFAFAPAGAGWSALQPAVGLPAFFLLCGAYFTMAFMLLGAVFLGVGALAGSIREIQLMSLPITLLQVGMFGLASASAASPGTALSRFAETFPLSSPSAMAARAANDPALWPHLLALAWQGLWVGLAIWLAARMFRLGVLKSGGGWRAIFGLR